MHRPAESTARAAGISAAGAWGGQTVWMAGTNVAQPATDEWVLHAFPQPGADRWHPDSAGTRTLTESDTDADAENAATQRHKALAASLEDTHTRLEEREDASPRHHSAILKMKEQVGRVQMRLEALPSARKAARTATTEPESLLQQPKRPKAPGPEPPLKAHRTASSSSHQGHAGAAPTAHVPDMDPGLGIRDGRPPRKIHRAASTSSLQGEDNNPDVRHLYVQGHHATGAHQPVAAENRVPAVPEADATTPRGRGGRDQKRRPEAS